ncbi:hypothetical protein [Allomuricauda sp. SCSIO 64092]|nr:hypothetical protein [Muricauda sp. SCSIO 64092]
MDIFRFYAFLSRVLGVVGGKNEIIADTDDDIEYAYGIILE